MTALDQVQFDQIPTEDDPTPAWQQYRQQRGETEGDHVIPRGTYDATLIEATLCRRKDGSGHLIRLVARTNNLGKYVLGWRGLGSNGSDPFDLTETEVKSLRKFAQSMGIPTPAPALSIVQQLQNMCGHPVTAKVVHTPVGIQATLFRDDAAEYAASTSTIRVGGQLVVANGRAIDEDGHALEGAAANAFVAHAQVLESQQLVRQAVATGAKGCYELHRSEGWLALGFATLSEYLAQPELEISRSEFYRLAKIHETYILSGGMDPEALAGASSSKLELPIPAIEQGVVSAEQGAADAEALTRNELRTRYRELLGTENDPDPTPERVEREPEEPSHRRDTDPVDHVPDAPVVDAGRIEALEDEVSELVTRARAAEDREAQLRSQLDERPHQTDLTHYALAQSLAQVLQRVLDEIGAPEQKRMGKPLRAVVQETLALARENGLSTDWPSDDPR